MPSVNQSVVGHDSHLDTDQDCQDNQASHQADQAFATCHQCSKHVGAKCTAAVKCIACRAQSHISCIVNNFVSTNGGAPKTSHQWLTGFLRVANFHFMCSTCASVGVNLTAKFPLKQQPTATNSTDLSKLQEISQLFTSFHSLHQQVDSMGQSIDVLQKAMLSKL